MTSLATSGRLQSEIKGGWRVFSNYVCPITVQPIWEILTILETSIQVLERARCQLLADWPWKWSQRRDSQKWFEHSCPDVTSYFWLAANRVLFCNSADGHHVGNHGYRVRNWQFWRRNDFNIISDQFWYWNYGQTVTDRAKLSTDRWTDGWTFVLCVRSTVSKCFTTWCTQSLQMRPNTVNIIASCLAGLKFV